MKKIKILTMLMALVAFTSCYNDEVADNQKADTSRPIVLSSALEKSRAVTQDEQIVSGQYVYAWADVASTQVSWFNRWLLTANGSGAFTCASGTEKYFPKGNAPVDIYAIHGRYQFAENAAFPSTGYTFSVHNDQTSTAYYCESDLLYGIKKNATYNAEGVNVKFYHMLSKLEVVLKASGALTDDDLADAEVNILGVQAQVTFTPEKLEEAGIADSPTRESMLTLSTEQQAAKTDIIMNTVVAPKGDTGFGTEVGEACIPPQSFDTDQFIKIVLHSANYNGTTLYVPLHNQEMHSGYKYTFQVTVNSHMALASIAVTPWGVESEAPVQMTNANTAKVGDYLFSDGTWGPLGESSSWTSSHYPIAVIFSNKTSATDRAAGYTHGYAVAIAGAGTQLAWATSGAYGVNHQVQDNFITSIEDIKNDLDGRTETAKIVALSDFSKENYPSFYYATHFGTAEIGLIDNTIFTDYQASLESTTYNSSGFAAPTNTSGWFLGSIGQYWQMAKNLGGTVSENDEFDNADGNINVFTFYDNGKILTEFERYFSNAVSEYSKTHTDEKPWMLPYSPSEILTWYWSSSESSATYALRFGWNINGDFNIRYDRTKYTTMKDTRGVRPVIAF